jgi:hypothetical protein
MLVLLIEHNIVDSNEGLTRLLYQIGTTTMLANYAANPFIYFISFDKVASVCKSKNKPHDMVKVSRSETSTSIL